MITNLLINNFKSLKSVYLKTKRVNLFIGYPNVGKSNVLEAMSFLSPSQSTQRFMDGYIRYDDIENLFYENDPSEPIIVASTVASAFLKKESPYSKKFIYGLSTELSPPNFINAAIESEQSLEYILE